MPELAEVELSRRRWDVALHLPVRDVRCARADARVLREVNHDALREALVGAALSRSEARGKQLAFRFGDRGDRWLGLHLGMTGELLVLPADHAPERHDHLVIETPTAALVFRDPRGFGRVRFERREDEPAWWSSLAPSVLDASFTLPALQGFLTRHGRAPLKAVLLRQERFPGVGNWMADEILWRAGLHPARRAGALDGAEVARLRRAVRRVARDALTAIAEDWSYPASWLFAHRWTDGGDCPRCAQALRRQPIGGRTTCWCPGCQRPPSRPTRAEG
ncbi:MAG: DNA-formamidopyrimidine glycosylase family protein [Polyangiales bacterium]